MVETGELFRQLPKGKQFCELETRPSKNELRTLVKRLQSEGLCGRRIAEEFLTPYFIASDRHSQREIDLLENVLDEEYQGTNRCVRTRQSKCSRLRGGCQGTQ